MGGFNHCFLSLVLAVRTIILDDISKKLVLSSHFGFNALLKLEDVQRAKHDIENYTSLGSCARHDLTTFLSIKCSICINNFINHT